MRRMQNRDSADGARTRLNGLLAIAILTAAALALAACTAPATARLAQRSPVPSTTNPAPSTTTPAPSTTSSAASTPSDPSATSPAPPRSAASCATQRSWDTGVQQGSNALTSAPLYLVRVGRHACY